MVTSVPYQLMSSQGSAEDFQDRDEPVAGQVRRGSRTNPPGDR
jgi:hypothetical protein